MTVNPVSKRSITFEVIVCFRLFFFQVHKPLCYIVVRGASRMRTGQGIFILDLYEAFSGQVIYSYTLFIWRPRCISACNLIDSVTMLRLHIRFQIFVLEIHLLSQRRCYLQSAAMKFNTAMHMITVACILKSFRNRD